MSNTIVMIHGMWATGRRWDNYVDYFGPNRYICLRPTLRFHDIDPRDKPDPRLGTTSLRDYLEDLSHVVNTLYEPPIIMGHSMGGLLALMLTARGLAKACVILTPAPPAGIWAILNRDVRGAFRSGLLTWAFWRKPHRPTFREARKHILNRFSPEEQKRHYDMFVHESGKAASEIGWWFLDKKKAASVDMSKVTCPTLIIGGSQDGITPAVITRKIARMFKHTATYKEYDAHAHWILEEPGWERVAEDIAIWLRQQK